VRVLDCAEQRSATRWWVGVARIVRGAVPWLRLVTRTAAIVRPRGAIVG